MKQLCEADKLASTFAIILACIGKNIYSIAKEKRFFYIDMLWFGTFCCLFGTFHCWSGNGIRPLERDHDFLEPITEVEPPLESDHDHDFLEPITEVEPPLESDHDFLEPITEVEPPLESDHDFSDAITKVQPSQESDHDFSDAITEVQPSLKSDRNNSDAITEVQPSLKSDRNNSDAITEVQPSLKSDRNNSDAIIEVQPPLESDHDTIATVKTPPVIDFSGIVTEEEQSLENDTEFFNAIKQVESGGNISAVGDKTRRHPAFGPFQITMPYYIDAVKCDSSLTSGGKNFSNVSGLGSEEYSKRVIRSYMRKYATRRRLGRKPTYEDIARIHNGGLNGFKSNTTKSYWNKVRMAMNKQNN